MTKGSGTKLNCTCNIYRYPLFHSMYVNTHLMPFIPSSSFSLSFSIWVAQHWNVSQGFFFSFGNIHKQENWVPLATRKNFMKTIKIPSRIFPLLAQRYLKNNSIEKSNISNHQARHEYIHRYWILDNGFSLFCQFLGCNAQEAGIYHFIIWNGFV